MSAEKKRRPGRYAYRGLTRIMHEKARLGILTSLATHPRGLFFTDLKELCALTDGNLARHLQALEVEELVETIRGSAGRRPQTLVRMTTEGRARFADYLAELEKVVADAAAAGEKAGDPSPEWPEGWSPA